MSFTPWLEELRAGWARRPTPASRARPRGPPCFSTSTRGLVDVQRRVVDARGEVVRGPRRPRRGPRWREEMRGGRRLLEHGAVGAEIAVEDHGAALPSPSGRRGGRMTSGLWQRRAPDVLGEASGRSRSAPRRGAAAGARGARRAARPRRRSPPSGTCPDGPHVGEERRRRATARRSATAAAARRRGPRCASRWTIALVLPPMAMSARIALSKASRGEDLGSGVRSSRHHLDDRAARVISASARRRESGAGIAALPGQRHAERLGHRGHRRGGAHHHAVAGRAREAALDLAPNSSSETGRRAARPRAPARRCPSRAPRCATCRAASGPPVTMIAGTSAEAAPISMAGVVLSQPDSSTTPSSG